MYPFPNLRIMPPNIHAYTYEKNHHDRVNGLFGNGSAGTKWV